MNRNEVRALDTADKRWVHTEYAVEATHEEMFDLWKEFHTSYCWEQNDGWGITIGSVMVGPDVNHLEKMPVTVGIVWYLINGHLVAFYEPTSQVVDHRMVEKYIDAKCSNKTNAVNFHHCIHHLNLGTPKRPIDVIALQTELEQYKQKNLELVQENIKLQNKLDQIKSSICKEIATLCIQGQVSHNGVCPCCHRSCYSLVDILKIL